MHAVQEEFKAGRGIELLDLETLNGDACMHTTRTLHAAMCLVAGRAYKTQCCLQALCLWWRCRTTQTSLVRKALVSISAVPAHP